MSAVGGPEEGGGKRGSDIGWDYLLAWHVVRVDGQSGLLHTLEVEDAALQDEFPNLAIGGFQLPIRSPRCISIHEVTANVMGAPASAFVLVCLFYPPDRYVDVQPMCTGHTSQNAVGGVDHTNAVRVLASQSLGRLEVTRRRPCLVCVICPSLARSLTSSSSDDRYDLYELTNLPARHLPVTLEVCLYLCPLHQTLTVGCCPSLPLLSS